MSKQVNAGRLILVSRVVLLTCRIARLICPICSHGYALARSVRSATATGPELIAYAKESETMPTDACQFFYVCTGCGAKLRPKHGDCCVFCSYGSVPCPPIQAERAKACGGGVS